MKVVILCGGKGTRLREKTEFMPKPLVEIGTRPILWHIMKIYSNYGFNDFVLCLGYKGEEIKRYFQDYKKISGGITLNLGSGNIKTHSENNEDWNITFAETGLETNTGGRIKKIEKYIDSDSFLCTYGDGLSNINLKELLAYHKSKGKIATMTCINPISPFGMIRFDEDGIIVESKEKPPIEGWINGGFFVFNKDIFNYIKENSILEKEVFDKLVEEKQLCAYPFRGFWGCMDTFKDNQVLNELWQNKKAPWKIWDD